MAGHGTSPTTRRHARTRRVDALAVVAPAAVARAVVAVLAPLVLVVAAAAPAAAQTDDPPTGATAPTSALPAFVLSDGRYTSFEVTEHDASIRPTGINDAGHITGEYVRSDGESGFVRRADGRLTTFDVPGARATEAAKINDAGQIVGRYSEDTRLVDDSARVRGFVRDARGDTTRLDVPGARHTRPTGINDGGEVVGYYVDGVDETHGFLWRDGRFTTIDLVDGASPTPTDINDEGEIVGVYLDAQGVSRGFLLAGERYTTISTPGPLATVPSGINDAGEIVGYTADDLMTTGAQGFLGTPGDPAGYTAVAAPGASRTLALGINDRGDVVGLDERADETAAWPDAAEERPEMAAGGSERFDLVTVRGITVDASIADRVGALLGAAEADGLALTGAGHRSPERQIELRRRHCGTSYYAVYEMPSSQCSPPTARPGRSMHERGLAVDFSCDGSLVDERSGDCFAWLAANAARYGLVNLPSEPWHWSVNGR